MNCVPQKLVALFVFWIVSDAEECNNRLPLADIFAYGYDLSEFDIYSCSHLGGERAVIFNANDCGNSLAFPKFKLADLNKTEYDMPSLLNPNVKIEPEEYVSKSNFFSNMFDVERDFIQPTAQFNYFGDTLNLVYTNSWYFKHVAYLLDQRLDVGLSSDSIPFLELELINDHKYSPVPPYMKLITPNFLNDVESLPETFAANEELYLSFVKKYGTHFAVSATFGGLVHRIMAVQRNKTHKSLEYLTSFYDEKDNIACNYSDGSRVVQIIQNHARNISQIMIGGWADMKLYSNRTLAFDAMRLKPAVLGVKFESISALIHNNDKRINVRLVTEVYLAKETLHSTARALKFLTLTRVTRLRTAYLLDRYESLIKSYSFHDLKALANELIAERKYYHSLS